MCPFCNLSSREKLVLSTQHFYAVYDRAPVTEGHLLLITKRHTPDFFSLDWGEWNDLPNAVGEARTHLKSKFGVEAYNIGTNAGETAGQTVMHCHLHIIPRRNGDVPDPRGGVRNLMAPLKELWPTE